jgi:uncharacterized protein (TIGR02145 family)
MKKAFLLILTILIVACSEENNSNSTNQNLSRPRIPILDNSQVQIGNQIWMTKNLNVERYRNGDIIPQVQNPNQWSNLTTGAWCYYANQTSNGRVYGKLYNGYAILDPRGIAPEGWHVPSNSEIDTLLTFLDWNAGGKLKSTLLWNPPNLGADNSTRFSALPSGGRTSFSGEFFYINFAGYFWTSTPISSTNMNHLALYSDQDDYIHSSFIKGYGLSVRCIKD